MTEEKKDFTLVEDSAETQTESSTEAAAGNDAGDRQPDSSSASNQGSDQPPPADAGNAQTQMPAIDFPTFVISLNQSALVHMGVVADPGSGKRGQNLALAKQTIDILAMLEAKTKGNLSEDESKLIQSLLYDLRIIYVRQAG